ncbi:MAG: leucine-rich repeat domain-containing protein, partial [Bacteroidota bacterium]|nr:leucine-rich repeat domain-containing protein [Bacteroidota bacterium]
MSKFYTSFIVFLLAILLSANCVFAQTENVDMSKYITLTVTQGETIKLKMIASSENTGVKVVSGTWDTTFIASTLSTASFENCTAASTTMTIYGNIQTLNASTYENVSKITTLDASHNTALKSIACYNLLLTDLNVSGLTSLRSLDCNGNRLESLDVNGLTSLKDLYCFGNRLTTLDVSEIARLERLICDNNQLTSLNLAGVTNLEVLDCSNNQLTNLDVSELTSLQFLYCGRNQLTSLDISGLTSLIDLYCYNNQLSTQTIDRLYCQLPDRTAQSTAGSIAPASSSSDAIVLATNKSNATSKRWIVMYKSGENECTQLNATTGTYVCGSEEEPGPEPSALSDVVTEGIILYPNPAKEEVTLKGIRGEDVKVFDLRGKLVKQETINEKLDIRDLESGVYYI